MHRTSSFFAISTSALIFAMAVNAVAETPIEARISGDHVNVRAAPDGESQVLGQLDFDARIILAGSADDPWVKLQLPESFDAWIYSELVKKDDSGRSVIGVNRAQLRAGPGLHHASIGMATRGQPLEIRSRSGDWTRISPSGLPVFGYVTNLYVKSAPPPPPPQPPVEKAPPPPQPPVVEQTPPPPPPAPEPEAATVVAPAAPEVPKPVAVDAPPALDDEVAPAQPESRPGAGRNVANAAPATKPRHTLLSTDRPAPVGPAKIPASRLRSDLPQARSGSYAGMLVRSPAVGASPTRWRLVHFGASDSKPETVCFVYGNDAQLSGLTNRALTISGAVYHFRSTSTPVIFAQDIVLNR